jgi:hypothetical protein
LERAARHGRGLPRLARGLSVARSTGFDAQGGMGYDVALRRRGAPVQAAVAADSLCASERIDVATACPKENSDGIDK